MIKRIHVPGYNLVFDTLTGAMMRWGNTEAEDPAMCPIGPEILDCEVSTTCAGIGKTFESRKPCNFCYKSNGPIGENMSLETFKTVLGKFPRSLTQVAFGIGDIDGNPDLWAIMEHCRERGIVPNLTTNGMGVTDEIAERLASLAGAIAVSHYHIDDVCFDAIEKLTAAGLVQCNVHKLLSRQTYDSCFELVDKAKSDPRLAHLRAIVFLLLKPKGKRNRLDSIVSEGDMKRLLDYAISKGVAVGMDSCSAPMVLKTMPENVRESVECCEALAFSSYVSVKGELFPCSFTEDTPGWETGIDMTRVEDFARDVWYHERVVAWRERLAASSSGCKDCAVKSLCRSCPTYPNITVCKEKNNEDPQRIRLELVK